MSSEPPTAAPAAEGDAAVAERIESAAPGRRSPRRRWRKWVVLGVALLATRLALPTIVAPLLAARLSRELGTRVDIGDLSFQPLDAIVTLRDVTVHAPVGTPADAGPPVVAKRMRVDLQWLPLLHQQVEVRALTLESAHVDLDRAADGTFSLADLDRAQRGNQLPQGWSFALDRVALRESQVRVRDVAAGGATLLEANVRDADISGLRRRATAFGKAKNLRVDALIGGGHLRIQGRYELRDDGVGLDTSIHVTAVPLAHLQPYIANLGWSGLGGQISARLRWQREPRRRDVLSGRIVLRRGSVQVAALAEPALTVRRAIADVSAIDLLTRRLTLGSLTLRGVRLAVGSDARAPILLPIVTPRLPHRSRADASRWAWTIERVTLRDSHVRVLDPNGYVDLRWQGSGENLGPGAYWSPLRMQLVRRGATAAFEGSARFGDSVSVEGHLTAGGIDFPSLARGLVLPWSDLVQAGRVTADLTVRLEPASGTAFPLDADGSVHVTDLWLAGPDPGMFGIGCEAIELTLDSLAPRESSSAGRRRDDRQPMVVFGQANVVAPFVLLTRTSDGWMLPPFIPADAPSTDVQTTDERKPDASIELGIRDVRSAGGRLIVVDMVPDPPITWDMMHVNGEVHRVTLPALAFDGLEVRGSDFYFGNLRLGGMRRGDVSHLEVSGDAVPLTAVTPYLQLAALPYRFASGDAAFSAQTSISPTRWSADTSLTLQAPQLVAIDPSLERAIGMPLPSALALLRNEDGDVTLQLALASLPAGSTGSYAGQIAAGVRNTIRGVTEAAGATARDEVAHFPIITLDFSPGQTQLTAATIQELAPVGDLLRARPGLVVTLTAQTSAQDRRWLAEQALQAHLNGGGGLMGVLRAIGVRDARARIGTALAARARGAAGLLDADDEALLARLVSEAPPLEERTVDALREVRIAHVSNYLTERYAISGKRIVVRADQGDISAATSSVRVQLSIAPAADSVRATPLLGGKDFD